MAKQAGTQERLHRGERSRRFSGMAVTLVGPDAQRLVSGVVDGEIECTFVGVEPGGALLLKTGEGDVYRLTVKAMFDAAVARAMLVQGTAPRRGRCVGK